MYGGDKIILTLYTDSYVRYSKGGRLNRAHIGIHVSLVTLQGRA